jgi:hypothetical protein
MRVTQGHYTVRDNNNNNNNNDNNNGNEVITRASAQDGKQKFLPIYERFYHLLRMIDALDLRSYSRQLSLRSNARKEIYQYYANQRPS